MMTSCESPREGMAPALSWQAVAGGAIAAAGVSLMLLLLGSGLGLAVASPWDGEGISAAGLGIGAVIWLIVMQWLSSGLGGYLAGRLRTRWTDLQADEILFRDTAHGFLAWALATLLTVGVLAGAVTGAAGAGAAAMAPAAAEIAADDRTGDESMDGPIAYYIDALYRTNGTGTSDEVRRETSRLIVRNMGRETFDPADRAYLIDLVSARTRLSEAQAEDRVEKLETDITAAKKAADEARKAAATLSLLTGLSMMIGAFIAAVAAGLGGQHRDRF